MYKRYFDSNRKGLDRRIQKGAYCLNCATLEELNLSGNSANIIWDEEVVTETVTSEFMGEEVTEEVERIIYTPRLMSAEDRAARDERMQLDSMKVISKLDLVRALRELNLWKEVVKPLIKGNEEFEDDWNNSTVIDTNDPVFQQGFAMTNIDMDTVKRKVLEMTAANNPFGI